MIRLGKFRGWAILAIVFPAISFFNIPAQASPALNAPIQITSNQAAYNLEDYLPLDKSTVMIRKLLSKHRIEI